MMDALVVDTSALIAILFDEFERPQFEQRLATTKRAYISSVNLVEFGLVCRSRLPQGDTFDGEGYVGSYGILGLDATVSHARLGLEGKRLFPILNFGDTFAYALAKDLDLPLLFKGKDFSKTDIRPALET